MLVKFEQNCMVKTTRNLELFYKKVEGINDALCVITKKELEHSRNVSKTVLNFSFLIQNRLQIPHYQQKALVSLQRLRDPLVSFKYQ